MLFRLTVQINSMNGLNYNGKMMENWIKLQELMAILSIKSPVFQVKNKTMVMK